ncbi:MAG: glycerol-3-phosphate 1-O-acyltransferase PlsY [Kiloniellales bacterium]|nr:glycerol-3-phosphate 1-O-acyltransferase PlsY [Kiloniellales bacterium]
MPDPISWEHAAPYLLAALFGGYLLGSVPFGLVVTRLAGLGDLRTMGSGNIGATNVLRTGRRGLAALTVLLDGGKGAAAVLLAAAYFGPDIALMAALGAVLGHLFPVWLKFRGGKGVATTFGVTLALAWPVGLAVCATWLLVAAVVRISSASALASTALAPLYAWLIREDLQLAEMCAILGALVWLRHWQNIGRLIRGREPKIGRKA